MVKIYREVDSGRLITQMPTAELYTKLNKRCMLNNNIADGAKVKEQIMIELFIREKGLRG